MPANVNEKFTLSSNVNNHQDDHNFSSLSMNPTSTSLPIMQQLQSLQTSSDSSDDYSVGNSRPVSAAAVSSSINAHINNEWHSLINSPENSWRWPIVVAAVKVCTNHSLFFTLLCLNVALRFRVGWFEG